MLNFTTLSSRFLSILQNPYDSMTVRPAPAFSSLFHVMLTVLVTLMIFFLTFVGKFFGLAVFNVKFSLLFDLGVPFVACVLASCVPALSNPMHALLSLVGVFLATILFYLKSGIEFIGLVTLIVYVGAVAILFLFVIMLLNVKSLTMNSILIKYRLQYVLLGFGLGLAAYLFVNLVYPLSTISVPVPVTLAKVPLTFPGYFFTEVYHTVLYRKADVNAIAGLYTTHAVLFWITTANLLLALLGSIILAVSTTEQTRTVVPTTVRK